MVDHRGPVGASNDVANSFMFSVSNVHGNHAVLRMLYLGRSEPSHHRPYR